MVERLWCVLEHCPGSAVSFYRRDFLAAKIRCEADSYSLLGQVARKKPSPNVTASRAYYQEALKRMPDHCEAHAYLGELFPQTGDFAAAVEQFKRLQAHAMSISAPTGCSSAFASLAKGWRDKAWCAPPSANKGPCLLSPTASSSSGPVTRPVTTSNLPSLYILSTILATVCLYIHV
jgi:tetratricopeptide (TPR) repeat protein